MKRLKPPIPAYDEPCFVPGCTAHIRVVVNPHTMIATGYHGEIALLEATLDDRKPDSPDPLALDKVYALAPLLMHAMMVESVVELHVGRVA